MDILLVQVCCSGNVVGEELTSERLRSWQRAATNSATMTAVEKLGRKVTVYTADLSSAESVAALVPSILQDGYIIDVLVNCAGAQRRHPCHEVSSDDWNLVYSLSSVTRRIAPTN